MQKVLIIGFGKSGRSAALFLLKKGKKVIAADQKAADLLKDPAIVQMQKEGLELVSDKREGIDFSSIAQVVLSPGIIPFHPLVLEARKRKIEMIGEIELGFRHFKNPAIGITGTNGKTTVTLLCAHVLQECGIKATALGNMGTALTSFSGGKEEVLVVELSSYQLETLQQECLDVAVILNLTPDHLDRYPSFQEYADAKCRIKEAVKKGGKLFLSRQAAGQKTALLEGESSALFDETSDLKGRRSIAKLISGKNLPVNQENALAAYRLCSFFGVKEAPFMKALKSFKAPPHRIEWAGEVRGVHFYNDSKATNIESVIHAVKTLSGPIHLIVGGLDKGSSYAPWKNAFKGKVKRLYAIGFAAKKIQQELESDLDIVLAASLFDAVQKAFDCAEKKEQILLSPGCASFDSFRNYEHRGEEFMRFVQELQALNQGGLA